MNFRASSYILALCFIIGISRGAETFDQATQRLEVDYTERLQKASAELAASREKIAAEKGPLLKRIRAAEDRIISADGQGVRLQTGHDNLEERRRVLFKDSALLRKNVSYLTSLAQDGLKGFEEGLAPGESQLISEQLSQRQSELNQSDDTEGASRAVSTAQFLLTQVEQSVGGYIAPGRATLNQDNQVVKGSFAFMGPEIYFRSESGAAGLALRVHEGGTYPVVQVLPQWLPSSVDNFFRKNVSALPADATAGKAMKLEQTQGTVWQHVQKGGIVAIAILAVGVIALILILQKSHDLSRLAVDRPATIHAFLEEAIERGPEAARKNLPSLKRTSRELFSVGLSSWNQPKEVLEERLQAVILRERLHYERRLPLLSVIATAAPLMGLLGTVIGMVRTFALITVFGTGNAGKLASGISEVLVSTELGLLVAIPTLVAHGVLSHRIQKNLALLERYALEFVTATQVEAADQKPPLVR